MKRHLFLTGPIGCGKSIGGQMRQVFLDFSDGHPRFPEGISTIIG